jgi:hypothetical protein
MKFKDDDEMIAWDQFAAAAIVAVQGKWEAQRNRATGAGSVYAAQPKSDADLAEASASVADLLLEQRRKRIS